MKQNSQQWYSIVLALLMVWFMLMLTTGVFVLVMSENKDTKAMEHAIKAFAGAEWSVELGLLKSKEYGYSISDRLEISNPLSKTLQRNGVSWNHNKDVVITYDIDATAQSIENVTLPGGEFAIIPLFSYGSDWLQIQVKNISLIWVNSQVVWNLIGESSGMAWVWDFQNYSTGSMKTIATDNEIAYSDATVESFLETSDNNYLILHNTWFSDVFYNVNSLNTGEKITKDITTILGSGEVAWYKQNLQVKLDNSQYLNLLKYSIFSPASPQ